VKRRIGGFLQAAIDYAWHVPRTMHNSDNLDRLLLGNVAG
jgi:hypothetical protein